MKIILSIFLSTFLLGCAAPIHKISLNSNSGSANQDKIVVTDSRLDKQIYITNLSVAGTHINMFEVNPIITKALSNSIQSSLKGYIPKTKIKVSINELDIKNRVGFAKRDKQTCIIESKVMIGSNKSKIIKTLSRNNDNFSPLITTAGKLILDQCINDHSRDVSTFIKSNG